MGGVVDDEGQERRLCVFHSSRGPRTGARVRGRDQNADGSRYDDGQGRQGKVSLSRRVHGASGRLFVSQRWLTHNSPSRQTDFRLVTTNAKTFNPPGSIYYAEADRLEAWGLDHIARASAHVIEYETDWNIDVEQDDDGSTSQLPVHIDDEVSTPRDMDGSMAAGSRAPSMTPAPGQAHTHGQGKRGPRGPYKRHAQPALPDSLDAEGRMPGAKDGVGAFPAGSDWAEMMIALKIKGAPPLSFHTSSIETVCTGKRYRTKKERLRFEKEGPPYHADGSLDYAESEFICLFRKCHCLDTTTFLVYVQWKTHSRF